MKDKLKLALKIARKQMSILICAGVVILGIVLSYWPTQGWFTELGQKVEQSIATGTQLDTLLNHERHLPNVSLDANGTGAALTIFPTQDVFQKGRDAVKAIGDQSLSILGTAVQINTHAPLVDGTFPNGNDIDRSEFARVYKAAVNDDYRIRNWPPPDLHQPVYPIPSLMAGKSMSVEEIATILAQRKDDLSNQILSKDASGQPTPESKAQFDTASAVLTKTLPWSLQYDAAKKFKVYLQSGAIKPPAVLSQFQQAVNALPTPTLWSAQLWLWMDEDVATAVARANAEATSVIDAPVKQILDVTIKDPPYLIVGDPNAGTEDGPLTPAPDASPTGRVSNGMYDVVQFSLSLDVAGNRVPEVLGSLERGQFITVLSAQSQAVDPAEKLLQGFVYGGGPVVRLDLVCEELMLHKWTTKLQPAGAGPTGSAAVAGGGPGVATGSLVPTTTH